MNREEAFALLRTYNKEPFHIEHGITVEQVMRYFASSLGYDQNFWGMVGLLHDVDFEKYPEEHCVKAREILEKASATPEMIHAICSHGYGLVVDIQPENEMEKVLFAVDELTGLIGATAKMRPSKSTKDMELSSLKKKFKDKKFAAGCSREVIKQGADMLEWDLDTLLEKTLMAMKASEDSIRVEMCQYQKI